MFHSENSQRSMACQFGRHTNYAEETAVNPRLVNYTFLTPKPTTQEPNVYAGRKWQNLTTFSNNPHLALLPTQSAHRRGV